MVQCSYAGCSNNKYLHKRRHVTSEEVYHYCDKHDPLDSDHAYGFEEVDDGK